MKKCSRCSKSATLHITELRDGVVQELHLCETCARDYVGAPDESDSMSDSAEDIMEEVAIDPNRELAEMDDLTCPNCGITFQEFRNQGRLGCPHDYIAFEKELTPLLHSIHGDDIQHCGKFPRQAPQSSQQQFQLIKLRNALRAAIEEESYEEAASLRDQISELEQSQETATSSTEQAESEPDPEA